jgi:hypothetical protein
MLICGTTSRDTAAMRALPPQKCTCTHALGRQTTPQHARNQYLTIHLLRAQAKSTASYIMNPLQSSKNHLHMRLLRPSATRESHVIKHRVYSARIVCSLRLATPELCNAVVRGVSRLLLKTREPVQPAAPLPRQVKVRF